MTTTTTTTTGVCTSCYRTVLAAGALINGLCGRCTSVADRFRRLEAARQERERLDSSCPECGGEGTYAFAGAPGTGGAWHCTNEECEMESWGSTIRELTPEEVR